MMNRNELLEKIAQIVLENPELKESMEMLKMCIRDSHLMW